MSGMIHGCDQSRQAEKSARNAIAAVTAAIHPTVVQGKRRTPIDPICSLDYDV